MSTRIAIITGIGFFAILLQFGGWSMLNSQRDTMAAADRVGANLEELFKPSPPSAHTLGVAIGEIQEAACPALFMAKMQFATLLQQTGMDINAPSPDFERGVAEGRDRAAGWRQNTRASYSCDSLLGKYGPDGMIHPLMKGLVRQQ